MRNSKKAIILLSGGLDSATTLAIAKKLGFDCYALSFNFKQRQSRWRPELSNYTLAWAEVIGSSDIFIGVNAVDYSGYPDCRPEYIEAYEKLAALATKAGVEGVGFKIHAPLIKLSKSEIIKEGLALGVDFSQTVSCYQANDMGFACGLCDSCMFRKEGFDSAGVSDPTKYQ